MEVYSPLLRPLSQHCLPLPTGPVGGIFLPGWHSLVQIELPVATAKQKVQAEIFLQQFVVFNNSFSSPLHINARLKLQLPIKSTYPEANTICRLNSSLKSRIHNLAEDKFTHDDVPLLDQYFAEEN